MLGKDCSAPFGRAGDFLCVTLGAHPDRHLPRMVKIFGAD